MTHLKPAEIIDAAEGRSSPEGQRHLESCARCEDQVREATRLLEEVRSVPAADPSPLFWERLSDNVRARIAEDPVGPRARGWIWASATAVAGAVALAIGLSNTRMTDTPRNVVQSQAPSVERVEPAGEDSSWSLVSDASEDLEWEEAEAAGLAVGPGTADHAVVDLSDDQREELARLLREEMARLRS